MPPPLADPLRALGVSHTPPAWRLVRTLPHAGGGATLAYCTQPSSLRPSCLHSPGSDTANTATTAARHNKHAPQPAVPSAVPAGPLRAAHQRPPLHKVPRTPCTQHTHSDLTAFVHTVVHPLATFIYMTHSYHLLNAQGNGLGPYLPGAGPHGGSTAHWARKAGAVARSRAGKWDEVGLWGVALAARYMEWQSCAVPCLTDPRVGGWPLARGRGTRACYCAEGARADTKSADRVRA